MNNHQENSSNEKGQMQIWLCRDCNQVHLRATNVMLDFTRREFLNLSNAILGILRYQFSAEDLKTMPNYNHETDEILLAETIV
ncbi:MAG: hypothetical protein HC846_09130 [Blastocatellia bacterium]|nr:hypothetical protein [Blastocatellia bacterium]